MMPRLLSDAALDALVADDVPTIDLTTHALAIGALPGRMVFEARQPMVVAASEEAARLLTRLDCTVDLAAGSGASLASGVAILEARGPGEALLRGWKVAQTMIEFASGIATAARRLVEGAQAVSQDVVVACTRKTVPGAKALSVKAIMAGGAVPHRLGLSETILLFEEHRRFLASSTPESIVRRLRRAAPEKKIVVEVATAEDGVTWATVGVDVIQAEKFMPVDIAALVGELRRRGLSAIVAAAGGITPENVAAYAATGARVLVTSWPYTAKPLDVQVRIEPIA